MAKEFSELSVEQRKFVAVCEWFAKMERISEPDWIRLTSDDKIFDQWASIMFDKYETKLTDAFIAELVLLRYFVPDRKSPPSAPDRRNAFLN